METRAQDLKPCQHVDCSEPATAHVAIPPTYAGLREMVMPYCDHHADEILGDRWTFPGARRVSVIS